MSARALSGGISNVVLAVRWPAGRAVLKQSLPRLRVPVEWEFDQARIVNERRCMAYLGTILPLGSVPTVLAWDDSRHMFAMSHAEDGGVVWKDALLAGEIDLTASEQAGRMLGTIHSRSAADPAVQTLFADVTPLLQGRVDPYHRTIAQAHPDLAAVIGDEIERMLATRRALVLGDWSPKNIIAYPDRVLALDFEVAHWGDPAFDVAFMLTHLVLKGVRRPQDRAMLRAAAQAFLAAYDEAAAAAAAEHSAAVAELGCLLLARIDGKSPAEYLTAEADREAVRLLARDILLGGERGLHATLDHALPS